MSNAPAPFASQVWREASILLVNGATAVDFLQGYLTCDSQRLTAQVLTPMALCNVKGRVVASGWAMLVGDSVALIVHVSLAAKVAQLLTPYARFSRCDISEDERLLHLCAQADESAEQQHEAHISSGSELGTHKFLLTKAAAEANSEATDCSATLNALLVKAEYAFISSATGEQFLPQMLALDLRGAVDFDKGCYLGQEIVARAQFRGSVKRELVGFDWQGTPPAPGEPWQQTISVVSVSTTEPGHGRGLAVASRGK